VALAEHIAEGKAYSRKEGSVGPLNQLSEKTAVHSEVMSCFHDHRRSVEAAEVHATSAPAVVADPYRM